MKPNDFLRLIGDEFLKILHVKKLELNDVDVETELKKKIDLPSGGQPGQVLTKTENGVAWV